MGAGARDPGWKIERFAETFIVPAATL